MAKRTGIPYEMTNQLIPHQAISLLYFAGTSDVTDHRNHLPNHLRNLSATGSTRQCSVHLCNSVTSEISFSKSDTDWLNGFPFFLNCVVPFRSCPLFMNTLRPPPQSRHAASLKEDEHGKS